MTKRFTILLAMIVTTLSFAICHAQTPVTDWNAEWVTSADVADNVTPNLWLAFRKTVDVEEVPNVAPIRIACDTKYWLWVNGRMLVFEGGLKRGPTPTDGYFDTVDIAPALRQGKNVICILQWYFGKEGFAHKNSGRPGLLIDGKIGDTSLLSDATWRGKKYSAYEQQTADPQPNYRLAESNVRFNAQNDFAADWTAMNFNDADWPAVKTFGKPPVAPWGKLFARPIPQWKDYGLKNYLNDADIPKISDGKPIACRLPYNAQVTPYLEIDAPEAGMVIDMRTDNYHGGSEYNVRAEYVTKAGEQSYESLGWMNGHVMIYTIPAGVKIKSLQFRETGYDTEFAGSFECDDPFYNKLWEKSVRTLYVTMRDNYMDCPDRERAQWWGDEVNELGEAFYALDPKSELLARKGMYELMNWQREDGTIFSPCPAGNWDKELPLQMLASVGMYGFQTWCRYADDYQPIIDLYPQIKKYMDLWQIGDDGLTVVRHGNWSWGDWGENIDLRVLTVCWHKLALDAQLVYMEKAGVTEDRDEVLAKIKSLQDNFNKVFWTGTEYRDPEYKGQTDDRANAMAVLAGFAEEDQYSAIGKILLEQKHASPYMEKYVLEALFFMGYSDDAMTRMKERFGKMVDHPDYTTMWEGWGIGAEGFGGGTINHAWSGGGLTCLAKEVVGLRLAAPGLKKFTVYPQMGSLKWIKSTTPTKYGNIVIEIDRTAKVTAKNFDNGKQATVITIVVPDGTSARLDLSAQSIRPLSVDNSYVYRYMKDGEIVSKDDITELSPGVWRIEIIGIMHIDR